MCEGSSRVAGVGLMLQARRGMAGTCHGVAMVGWTPSRIPVSCREVGGEVQAGPTIWLDGPRRLVD